MELCLPRCLRGPTTRRYSKSEKDQEVRLVRKPREDLGTSQGTIQRVAVRLGDGVESVWSWVRERDVADGLAGSDAQRVTELEARNRQLEQELRETRRANEILKKAAAYSAQADLDRPQKWSSDLSTAAGNSSESSRSAGRCRWLRARTTQPGTAKWPRPSGRCVTP